jgi:purine-binding chemotaxis protein CheW
LADDVLAIELEYVKEIVGIQTMTKVPKVPKFLEGVINLRGKPIPVINVRKKFGLEPTEIDYKTSFVIVEYQNTTIALLVDWVRDVVEAKESEMSPYKNKDDKNHYLRSLAKINGETIMFVDCEKFLDV